MDEFILILDFGGQYKELIARTVRSMNVYSEIRAGNLPSEEIKRRKPIGIILTGGPGSVFSPDAPHCDAGLFRLGIPILGICFGMQLICQMLGGAVTPGKHGEYGKTEITLDEHATLFKGIDAQCSVLMSHNDQVSNLPGGFIRTAHTAACAIAACENPGRKVYGVQFHPEAALTQSGYGIFKNFVYGICGASGSYKLEDYLALQLEQIRAAVGKRQILLALSGGVDSSVCAALIARAVPQQLTCIFVDHGFMRQDEGDEIECFFCRSDLRFIRINAQQRFLRRLTGVSDPEQKRARIGEEFIRVFEEAAAKLNNMPILAQGTIYPDIIESGGKIGATIKSHHNVGGLPDELAFEEIIEPLSGLFKDEVRELGKKLGLPRSLLSRQPFPGPGLAIRIIGEVTEAKLAVLRHADCILREEIAKVRRKPDQYFAVLTGIYTVGVKGDARTYDHTIAIRAVTTGDFMTCVYTPLSHHVLNRIAARITNEVLDVNRVVYDITSKPPATVEWE